LCFKIILGEYEMNPYPKQPISQKLHNKYSRQNRLIRSQPSLLFISILILIIYVLPSFGDTYTDNFDTGIDTTIYWKIQRNDTLYRVDDTQGDVRFSRSPGGAQVLNTIHLIFQPIVRGDFDVSVDFSNAYINRINGSPGNQVQLNSTFGGQVFSVVRSDEEGFGHNYHVWIAPPWQWQGYQPNTDTSGTLRIQRAGSTVAGYFNSNLIFSYDYNTADVMHLSFSLQNNQTTDSTSVIFDNFSITADSILISPTRVPETDQKITSFKLQQNFPNPFNPTTTISFELPQTEFVALRIYNLLGEEISILVSKRLFAGKYQYEWDASDFTSGVYLYKLQAGDYVEVKKMVLMK
jgi:hypothetical protein